MPSVIHPHHDQRPQRFAWAPGSYIAECSHCGKRFLGDKRARLCAPCAYNDEGHAKLREALSALVAAESASIQAFGHKEIDAITAAMEQARSALKT